MRGNELDRLKPLLYSEAQKRNENTCIYYDYNSRKTRFENYENARSMEINDEGYIVLVSFIKTISDDRVDEIVENEEISDAELDDLVDWVIQMNEEVEGRKNEK
jgi:hypothetical protein